LLNTSIRLQCPVLESTAYKKIAQFELFTETETRQMRGSEHATRLGENKELIDTP
jgi:hypothetical protein